MADDSTTATTPSPEPAPAILARPKPLGSLTASARRITGKSVQRNVGGGGAQWQTDAWDMYDLVGELRFLAVTLAGRLAQARLYVGRIDETDPSETPAPVDDADSLNAILEAFGGSAATRSPLVYRLGVNLFVTGEGWLVGIPNYLLPMSQRYATTLSTEPGTDEAPSGPEPGAALGIDDLRWYTLSVSEVTGSAVGEVTLRLGEGDADKLVVAPADVVLIRVWRPHPRKAWEADSSVRSNLTVLREIVGFGMHINSQIDSRLAGAGVLIVPQSAQRAAKNAAGLPEDDPSDPFTEALIEAMLTPIRDRDSASALVPLVITVPDEVTEKIHLLTFDKPLDLAAPDMRDRALVRLAHGLDAPPELMLGTASMNHWGKWLVQEDVVRAHIEPPLALVCDALTVQYLWPVLGDQGMSEDEAQQYVIWYDVSDLMTRPNRSQDAITLHERHVIGDEALRTATGFDDTERPFADREDLPEDILMALGMAHRNPALLAAPGLPELVRQVRAVLANDIPTEAPAPPPQLDPNADDDDDEELPADEDEAPSSNGTPAAPSRPSNGVPTTDADPPRPTAAPSPATAR